MWESLLDGRKIFRREFLCLDELFEMFNWICRGDQKIKISCDLITKIVKSWIKHLTRSPHVPDCPKNLHKEIHRYFKPWKTHIKTPVSLLEKLPNESPYIKRIFLKSVIEKTPSGISHFFFAIIFNGCFFVFSHTCVLLCKSHEKCLCKIILVWLF